MIGRQLLVVLVAAAPLACGCASLNLPTPGWPTTAAGDPKQPGSPAWWKRHKKTAEFVPNHGYRVADVDGYFDQDGRPINSRVAKVVDKPEEGEGLLNDAGLQQAVGNIKKRVGLGPNQKEADRQYQLGEANFRAEHYEEAAECFRAAAKGWPDSALAQDALFQLGESLFFAERYPKANDAFEELVRKFPNSPHLDKVITRQFAMARYWEQYADYDPDWVVTPNLTSKRLPLFDTLGRALKVYENIRLNDPTGPLADDAIMATANSYFRRGRYNDADYQYDLLRKEYPRSDHQYNAHVLGLECKMRRYQGPDYDGTPLQEAELLVKQQRTQFAGELDLDQRQRLGETEARVKFELANREFLMAKHFDDLSEYGSAKFYYGQVLKNHPATPLAEQARTRIAELGGLPDSPEPKLAWLINRLPESAERAAVAQIPLVEGADSTRLAEAPDDGAPSSESDAASDTIRR